MKQGTKMSISHFIFLFHVFSLSISPSLCLSGVGTAAGYMKTIHHCIIYHKIIDSEEGVELYWLHFTRLDIEKSHTACSENMKTYINNKRHPCFWDGVEASLKRRIESKIARQHISAATDETERPNKVIKECLPFAHERSTAKSHLFPLPLSLYTLLSPSVSPLHSSVH